MPKMSNDSILYITLIVALLLGVRSFRFRLPEVVGRRGERRVSKALSTLDPSRFRILNDILMASPERSSQIDHLVFSRRGIFVIETKNFRGWIHGNENSNMWTQTIYRRRYRFPNPIQQNLSHVRILREVLKISSHIPIYPIVVFAGSAELKNVDVNAPVIYTHELTSLIERTGTDVLANEQMEELFDQVRQKNLMSKEDRKIHLSSIRTKVEKAQVKTENRVCPRCGGKLILRKGSYSEFFGCGNYPKCRFTLSLEKRN